MINNIRITDTKPWYKYFWPWAVIFVIFWTLLSGAGMIWFANYGGSYSLVDGYSKVGKFVSSDNSWSDRARELGISAILKRDRGHFRLTIIPEKYAVIDDLELVFLHPTDAHKDIYPKLNKTGMVITASVPEITSGWRVKLRDSSLHWELANKFATRAQTVVELE